MLHICYFHARQSMSFGGCPPCAIPPPFFAGPFPIVEDWRGHDEVRHRNDHGSFSTNQVIVAGGASAPVSLGATNFSDGITNSGGSLRFHHAGTYNVNVTIPVTGTSVERMKVTLTATGSASGIPSPVSVTTVDGLETENLNSSFTIRLSDHTSISFHVAVEGPVSSMVTVGAGTISGSHVDRH